ncbi:TetR/AcrR family transcriptional regulator [Halocatena pleomorpha]|uniref:TetR/AcrR family transcriptional regulator n=1 Tax=Halocatena pleomorpha TaxID=1785090 RepID=A0A3P3RGH9_9EURY|nr:TetR/AcrR family transcriptional regulator [Halocatena pleomorpha]RRJ31850.1 TetR/AcrR family transcriptional regulator [Halocatena pleomorpha]
MAMDSVDQKWSTAEREIMEATYRAMLEHGYPGLSISRIAEQFDKSKASIYYHYDSKDELLVSFLDFVVDQFKTNFAEEIDEDPSSALNTVIERLVPLQMNDEEFQGRIVLIELRSQATRNEAFREKFTEINELLVTSICEIIERGIEDGTFRDVEAARVAEHIVATVNGSTIDRVTTNREVAPAAVRLSLSSYIDSELKSCQ